MIEPILQLFKQDPLILIIILAMLVVFALLFIGKRQFRETHGPEILTTIGILGTFLGISYSIYQLSSSPDIISSLPLFIGGLKFAFVASTVGVLCAVILKLIHFYTYKNETGEAEKQTGGSQEQLIINELKNLTKGLVGNEEGTLLTQMKLIRADSNDQLAKLRKSFDEFATHMVENNQKAFIEALNKAISDFNKNLTDQFGENFKQLNVAVEKLVIWQQQYKAHLEDLIVIEGKTVHAMSTASDAYKEMVENSQVFRQVSIELHELLPNMKTMTETLFIQSRSLADVLMTLREVTPQFEAKMSIMLDNLDKGMTKLVEHVLAKADEEIVRSIGTMTAGYSSVVSSHNESIRNHSTNLQTVTSELKNSMVQTIVEHNLHAVKFIEDLNSGYSGILASHSDAIKNFTSTIQMSTSELKELLSSTIRDNQKIINSGLADSLSKIRDGITTLDKGLEKELTRSLEGLSHQLASLSAKFVEDYTPLTEKLRDVVRIANSVNK